MTQPGIPLGHTIPAHRAFGWCSHCPDHTVAEELAAWQTREPIDVSPGPAAEIDRLRTANERMRHELEVMYGGAFDKLPEPAAVSAAVTEPTDPTHGLSVPHADALWDAVAIPGPHTPTYPEQHERVCRAVRNILDELTPAPADRAAVLADVERAIRAATSSCGYKAEDGCDFCNGVDAALDQVRRMADETATETPEDPARIDRLRPEFTEHASVEAIDAQLDRARRQERRWHIRAEWLIGLRQARADEPAAGARQDGAET